ncbi:1-aminocyclopropane-1-carboxylate oxidase homolog 3-like [Eucalyptus grandis]|uniref:1-aminocyclopropane-1-carboxylate oxidase homolog 3-like n=1 Tax=Eucalyptus grandis TaxID=71139 RepID=UPI00192EEA99|nr:1-aminocyclopropane-1-carboxylate oxidase homolog 3-like [Eucalyptus grandis]
MEWDQQIQHLGGILMGLLSEGLELSPKKLQELTCLESRMMVGNYYPYYPQPDLTVGLVSHTVLGVIAVLLQDQLPDHVQQRVQKHKAYDVGQPNQEPNVSIVVFYNLSNLDIQLRLLPKLVSSDKPAAFQQFTVGAYLRAFFTTELDESLVDYFMA